MDAVRARARELDLEPDHVFQVCRLALSIFDQSTELHHFGAPERALLEAGALLHDVGYQRGAQRHHKHSRDVILGLELPGFSETQRKIVACLARYHRKADPNPSHAVFRDLNADDQAVVQRLAAILRIADGLDRLHVASAQALRIEHAGGILRILVQQRRPCPTDLWGGLRKAELFQQVFGVRVELIEDKD